MQYDSLTVNQKIKYAPLKILAISLSLVSILFIWQGSTGFSLWDEGYLWYGVQRVLQGEIPIRDFMSYDPGRYYWSAALLSITGEDGIIALRTSVAIFQGIGLLIGLLLVSRSAVIKGKSEPLFWIVAAATLALWMFPRHKLFDISLSIFLIGILTFLIIKPTPTRYFYVGLGVGLIAVFGRNHGVYGVIGSAGVIIWLGIKNTAPENYYKGIPCWAIGVVIGYLPVILMLILIPGFAISFWESIQFLFERKATNIALPIPWPWSVNFTDKTFQQGLHGILVGLFFIGIIIFSALSPIWAIKNKIKQQNTNPVLVAASFLAFPYAHYAFSRADISHLAQGIFPFLIGSLVITASTSKRIKWPLASALFMTSLLVTQAVHPGYRCYASKRCVSVMVSDNNLLVLPKTASDINLIYKLAEEYAPSERLFVATPFWPGAYALLEKKSPMWEIYALFSRNEDFQQKEIERIKESKPGFVIVFDFPLDGREDLRFKNTHPLIQQYILENFEPIPYSQNPAYQIYKGK